MLPRTANSSTRNGLVTCPSVTITALASYGAFRTTGSLKSSVFTYKTFWPSFFGPFVNRVAGDVAPFVPAITSPTRR